MALFSSSVRRNKPPSFKEGGLPQNTRCWRDKSPGTLSSPRSWLFFPPTWSSLFIPRKVRSNHCFVPCWSEPLCPIYSFLWLALSSHNKTLRAVFWFVFGMFCFLLLFWFLVLFCFFFFLVVVVFVVLFCFGWCFVLFCFGWCFFHCSCNLHR